MPIARPIQTNFTGGELSPRLYGRVDTNKYQNGAKTLENFIVMPHGGAKKRPGTKYVNRVKNHADQVRLVPFQYNAEQAYVLEFGPSYIRFFANGGILTQAAKTITGITKANPAVVTANAHGYSNGDRVILSGVGGMTEVNGVEFTVAGVTTNTFQLSGINSSSYTTYTSGGSAFKIVEVSTTYTSAELDTLSFSQSADVLYIAHRSHPLAQLVRTSATSWTLSDVEVLRGPWRGLNNDQTITIKASAKSGTGVTITASSALFNALQVGSLIKLYTPGRANGESEFGNGEQVNGGEFWSYNGNVYEITGSTGGTNSAKYNPPTHKSGTVRLFPNGGTGAYADTTFLHQGFAIVKITGFTSSTVVTGTVYSGWGYQEIPLQLVDNGNARYREPTKFWQEGAWSDHRGYPGVITFFEQRLMAASSLSNPQTIYGSVSGNFTDFEEGTNDDQALNYTLASEQVDVIRWINPGKVLIIGTTSGEYVMQSSSLNEAITPKNIRISRETSYGSAPCNPVRVGNAVLFAQRRGDPDNAGRKIREMAYSFNINGFESNDLTIWSEHITGEGVTEMAYQADPDALVWAVRTDGRLACLTYEKAQEVVAWHKHVLGGFSNSGKTLPAAVESITSIPGANGDELWLVVKRYINGATVRYVEVMSHWDDVVDKADGIFSDSAITYSGSSTSTITGLQHLAGETVKVLGNGSVLADVTVSATGTVTLASAVTKAQIGLGYTAALETLDIEAGAQGGTAQGRNKRISNMVARLHRSLGGKIGPSADKLDDILYRTPSDPMGSSPALFSGDRDVPMPTGWDTKGAVHIQHSQPLPMTVIAVMPEVNTTG